MSMSAQPKVLFQEINLGPGGVEVGRSLQWAKRTQFASKRSSREDTGSYRPLRRDLHETQSKLFATSRITGENLQPRDQRRAPRGSVTFVLHLDYVQGLKESPA